MKADVLVIKNMVCPRCIAAVEKILIDLNVPVLRVELGKVYLEKDLPQNKKEQLDVELTRLGFEWLKKEKQSLVTQIKSVIIQSIHHEKDVLNQNFSDFLSEKLNHEYTYLSKLFSKEEGQTIEHFLLNQKIEKIKELLSYDELTLSEIAFQLNYSSSAYLSSQFKKITGLTPSAFKKQALQERKSIDLF